MSAKYSVAKFKLPGVIDLATQPKETTILVGLFAFAVFSLLSFFIQNMTEKSRSHDPAEDMGYIIDEAENLLVTNEFAKKLIGLSFARVSEVENTNRNNGKKFVSLAALHTFAGELSEYSAEAAKLFWLHKYHKSSMSLVIPGAKTQWARFDEYVSGLENLYAEINKFPVESSQITSFAGDITSDDERRFRDLAVANQHAPVEIPNLIVALRRKLRSLKHLDFVQNSLLSFYTPFFLSLMLIIIGMDTFYDSHN